MNATKLVWEHAPVDGSDLLALLWLATRYDLGDHSFVPVEEIATKIRLTVNATRKVMALLMIDNVVKIGLAKNSDRRVHCGPFKLNFKTLARYKRLNLEANQIAGA